ncbi:rRNA maturation RNase YbeY [bacterium]|nr:rRNA maturation RNase YbeY [bacterium]
MVEIEIADSQKIVPLRRAPIRRLVHQVLRAEEVTSAKIVLAFVDNEVIHRVNRQHLQHDYPTDVITFPYESHDADVVGEIVISTEFAAQQAPRFGHTIEQEIMLYIIHGLLHLVGYDDHDAGDARQMKRRQEQLLHDWNGPVRAPSKSKPTPKPASRSVKSRPKAPKRGSKGPA